MFVGCIQNRLCYAGFCVTSQLDLMLWSSSWPIRRVCLCRECPRGEPWLITLYHTCDFRVIWRPISALGTAATTTITVSESGTGNGWDTFRARPWHVDKIRWVWSDIGGQSLTRSLGDMNQISHSSNFRRKNIAGCEFSYPLGVSTLRNLPNFQMCVIVALFQPIITALIGS